MENQPYDIKHYLLKQFCCITVQGKPSVTHKRKKTNFPLQWSEWQSEELAAKEKSRRKADIRGRAQSKILSTANTAVGFSNLDSRNKRINKKKNK